MDIGSEIWHEAFSLFSLIVIHVARGNRIALAPAVLASIYRDMTLLKGKIAESTLLGIPKGKYDGLTVMIWPSMQLVEKVENVSLVLDSGKESFSSGESTLLGTPKGIHDDLTVNLWSSMQLVQVWVWKRFNEQQRPEPNLMKSGYPRLARWNIETES
uniref:Aminotransferase-like plant mobile domain-containing protein n=1 Tax=Populus alba TaxID=43335 RepID=A0A4U5MZR9_POPAL|nr:hypothetical protein D5086_0000284960 [Populus alba]